MSVVTAVAALAAIGLLFAMDPGGAIAESGFPDFREMDRKQLAVWGFRTNRRSRGAVAHYRAVAVAQVPDPAGDGGASAPMVLGDSEARFNARGGGICAGRPHDMEPDDAGLHHRDVPAAARCESRPSEQEVASCTGCLGRLPYSMTGSERYAKACRRMPQRLMRSMKR